MPTQAGRPNNDEMAGSACASDGPGSAQRLTQPTLGRQIAALEAALGRTLFTRSTDGLRPTDSAEELVPHAEAMAAAAAAALVRTASGNEDELRGTVRLAASGFMGAAVLPPMLARFRSDHPKVEIELS